ncbi:hypothetical protein C8A05DRAFT_13701 [Staphylotrichum tortipilum]|uniref:CASTOR ACT domain-containing protein n=1 Tax=Staphylotrichum tortipilum TaxID=2831512 RepID=A0AAN6MPZ6_9PEZI|nr:hypothetical protein C8A05DRAFT_13701 [Staphylotrichum longicolle]
MNAQVSFLDGTLSLIHIPLDLYSTLLQPILQILLPPSQDPSKQGTLEGLSLTDSGGSGGGHGFLNISVTPLECSIVCDSAWAESVFEPAIRKLPKAQARTVAVSKDTYAALSVYGAGMDAGSRVVELTSPLALANIPIFFITTYYSDFILVPVKDRQTVVKTLLAKGFVFSDDDQSHLVSANPSPTSASHRHAFSFSSSHTHSRVPSDDTTTPPSPPSSNVNDLQQRTFDLLKRRNVVPHIAPDLVLVQCTGIRGTGAQHNYHGHRLHHSHGHGHGHHNGGHHGNPSRGSNGGGGSRRGSRTHPCWVDTIDARLYTSVVAALVAQPRFLSVTLAHEDPPSLLLDRELLGLFGESLVGPTEGALVPIFLDLADLPFEATGIVSGVAGRLVREMRMGEGSELSYLATARSGAVVLSGEQAGVALGVLMEAFGE